MSEERRYQDHEIREIFELRFAVPAFFAIGGTGMIGGARIAMSRRADQREAQMERVTTRARALLDAAPASEPGPALRPSE